MIKLSKYRSAWCTKDGTGYFSLYEKDEHQYFEVCRVYHNAGEPIDQLKARANMLTILLNSKFQKK